MEPLWWWARMDSNHQPNDYESFALPLSYGPAKDDSIGPICWGQRTVSFGDFLFFFGIGLVVFGLFWRSRRRRSREGLNRPREAITRHQFFTGPFAPIFAGIVIAFWSLYETGNL